MSPIFDEGTGSKRVLLAISSVDQSRLVNEHKDMEEGKQNSPSISLICEVDVRPVLDGTTSDAPSL